MDSQNITHTKSECIAQFFTFKERGTLDQETDIDKIMATTDFIEDDAIINCSISRDKNSCSDNFQLTLKPKKNYYNLVKPGDWVIIYLDDNSKIDISKRKGIKCVGSVNRVAKNRVTTNDGNITVTYSIHGSGFGKVFENTEMYYNPYANADNIGMFLNTIGFDTKGSPFDFVDKYLTVFLGKPEDAHIPDNVLFTTLIPPSLFKELKGEKYSKQFAPSFNDILVREFDENTKEGYSSFRSVSRLTSGSLWTAMKQASNEIVNELFTDLRDGIPTIIFRKMPLTKELRQKLINDTVIDLPQKFIINSNLGTSDHEIYNYVNIFSTDSIIQDLAWLASAEFPTDFPKVNRASTQRHALRRIDRNTEYGYDGNNDPVILLIDKWANELAEYWFNYYHFETGSFDVIGKNDFEIGSFIHIPEEGTVYMVESISWEWSFGETIVTSLSVSTGLNRDGTFIDASKDEEPTYGTTNYQRTAGKK